MLVSVETCQENQDSAPQNSKKIHLHPFFILDFCILRKIRRKNALALFNF